MRSAKHVPAVVGVATGASPSLAAVTLTGTLTLSDVDVALGTTTGTKIGTASNQKLGFYGVTPVVRPSAITQTYSTTATTLNALTATTIATADVGAVLLDVVALLNETKAKYNALLVDHTNLAGVLNKVLDNLQLQGLAQ